MTLPPPASLPEGLDTRAWRLSLPTDTTVYERGWRGQVWELVEELTMQERPVPFMFDPTKADPLRVQLASAVLQTST